MSLPASNILQTCAQTWTAFLNSDRLPPHLKHDVAQKIDDMAKDIADRPVYSATQETVGGAIARARSYIANGTGEDLGKLEVALGIVGAMHTMLTYFNTLFEDGVVQGAVGIFCSPEGIAPWQLILGGLLRDSTSDIGDINVVDRHAALILNDANSLEKLVEEFPKLYLAELTATRRGMLSASTVKSTVERAIAEAFQQVDGISRVLSPHQQIIEQIAHEIASLTGEEVVPTDMGSVTAEAIATDIAKCLTPAFKESPIQETRRLLREQSHASSNTFEPLRVAPITAAECATVFLSELLGLIPRKHLPSFDDIALRLEPRRQNPALERE